MLLPGTISLLDRLCRLSNEMKFSNGRSIMAEEKSSSGAATAIVAVVGILAILALIYFLFLKGGGGDGSKDLNIKVDGVEELVK